MPRPVAEGLLGAVQGLVAGLGEDDDDISVAARAAHQRLVARVQELAEHGDPDAAIGAPALARLMGAPEAMAVDLGRLARQADAERDRMNDVLAEACARIDPGRPVREVVDRPPAATIPTATVSSTRRAGWSTR